MLQTAELTPLLSRVLYETENFLVPHIAHMGRGAWECLLARANLGDGTGDLLPHPEQKREGGWTDLTD